MAFILFIKYVVPVLVLVWLAWLLWPTSAVKLEEIEEKRQPVIAKAKKLKEKNLKSADNIYADEPKKTKSKKKK